MQACACRNVSRVRGMVAQKVRKCMSGRRAVALRHVAFEDLGVLAPLLREHDYEIDYLDVGIDPLTPDALLAPDLLVVLGGPIGVYQEDSYPFLVDEIEGIGRRLAAGRVTLGVCLGAQLMARALGAEVRATGRTEIGYSPLTLTEAGAASVLAPLNGVSVLHWHGDEFAIPDGATRLASTPGFPHQAFQFADHGLGLQFHLEADYRRIESWLVGHAHELGAAGLDPTVLRADAAVYGPRLADAARQVFEAWLG